MSILPSSKEQESITNKLGTLHNIAYTDVASAIELIVRHALIEVGNEKGFVLCAPKDIDRLAFSSRLEDAGLSHGLLSIRYDDIVTKEDLAELAIKVSMQNEDCIVDEHALDYNYLYAKIKNQLKKFSRPLFGDLDWYGLQESFLKAEHKDKLLQLHSLIDTKSFGFNAAEFLEMRTLVAQSSYLFDVSFDHTTSLSRLVDHTKGEDYLDKINDITYRLFGFIEEASTLRDDYYTVLRDMEDDYTHSVVSWKEEQLDQLHILRSKITGLLSLPKEVKTGFKINIFSKVDQKQQAIGNSIFKSLETILGSLNISGRPDILESLMIEEGSKYWDVIITEIENKAQERSAQLEVLLKSINKLNANNKNLYALEDHLSDFLNRINHTDILNEKIEFNTLSFKKQVEFTAKLVTQLENLILEIEKSTNYFHWISFISAQHSNLNNVISALYGMPTTEWESAFNTFYIYEWMRQVAHKDLPISKNSFEALYESFDQDNNVRITKLKSQISSNKIEAATLLKQSNSELYKAIYKGARWTTSQTWGQLLVENSSYFVKVFPILSIDRDHLQYLKKNTYQSIHYLDAEQHDVEVFHHFTTIHTYISMDKVTKSFVGSYLNLPSLSNYLPIARWTLGNRSSFARMICQHLSPYAHVLKVFHLKNITIISFANAWLNESLVDYFYHLGIKEVKQDTADSKSAIIAITDNLMNALCDESRQYLLLTQDFLMNRNDIEDILYQKKLVDTLEYSGIKVLNISSQEMIADANSTVDALFDHISSLNNHIQLKSHKQIELEIN